MSDAIDRAPKETVEKRRKNTHLEERILFFRFKLVGTENLNTAGSLFFSQTFTVALEELEDVLDGDGLDVDLLLVVQVLGLELDLNRTCTSV